MPSPADLTDDELERLIAEKSRRGADLSRLSDDELEQRIAAKGPSATESFARGAGQGISLGFLDELASYPMAAMGGDPLLGLDLPQETFGERREAALAHLRERNAKAANAHPVANTAGAIAGGVALPFGTARTLGGAVRGGAALGALSGAGTSEADSLLGVAGDAALGAGLGGALGAGGYGAGKAVTAAAPHVSDLAGQAASKLKSFADFQVGKSFGVKGRVDLRAAGGREAVEELGREASARGWAGNVSDMLPWGQDRVAQRVARAAQSAGSEIGTALDDAGKAGAGAALSELTDSIDQVAAPLLRNRELYGPQLGTLQKLRDLVARRTAEEGGQLSPRSLNEVKRVLAGEVSSWHPNPLKPRRDLQPVEQALYGVFQRAEADAVGAGLGDDARAAFDAAKQTYGYTKAADLLLGRAAEADGNQLAFTGGLHSHLGTLMGAASGGVPGALALGAASRLSTSPQALALGARGLQRGAEGLQEGLAGQGGSKLGQILANTGQRLAPGAAAIAGIQRAAQDPRYGEVLTNAAQRGPQAVAATHWVLQQRDPNYQALTLEPEDESRQQRQ